MCNSVQTFAPRACCKYTQSVTSGFTCFNSYSLASLLDCRPNNPFLGHTNLGHVSGINVRNSLVRTICLPTQAYNCLFLPPLAPPSSSAPLQLSLCFARSPAQLNSVQWASMASKDDAWHGVAMSITVDLINLSPRLLALLSAVDTWPNGGFCG